MKPYRNWHAICNEPNPWLRMLLITTDDVFTLQRLKRSFPDLFQDKEINLTVVPISIIMAIKKATISDGIESAWYAVLEQLAMDIPMFEWGTGCSPGTSFVSEQIPSEWVPAVKQAVGTEGYYSLGDPKEGIFELEWNGEQCLLVDADMAPGTDEKIETAVLIPKRCIDLDL